MTVTSEETSCCFNFTDFKILIFFFGKQSVSLISRESMFWFFFSFNYIRLVLFILIIIMTVISLLAPSSMFGDENSSSATVTSLPKSITSQNMEFVSDIKFSLACLFFFFQVLKQIVSIESLSISHMLKCL